LKQSQLNFNKLRTAYDATQRRIKELEKQLDAITHQSTKRVETDAVSQFDEEIKNHTKKFMVLHELFTPSSDAFFSRPPPQVDLFSSNRYKDNISIETTILGEVYFVFPDHTHHFIRGHSKFHTDVSPTYYTSIYFDN
jgi:hypothetical protein